MREVIGRCRGCAAEFYAGEEDRYVEHIDSCDFVDGAGNPLSSDQREDQQVRSFLDRLPALWRADAEGALSIAYTHGWRDHAARLEATGENKLLDAIQANDEDPPSGARPYLPGPP
jgi:hypothetical protein